jgi:hypothetical protein
MSPPRSPAKSSSIAPRRARAVILAHAVLALAVMALALAPAMIVPAGAFARATSAHSACAAVTARHTRHGRKTGSRCNRGSSRRGPSAHQPATHGRTRTRTARKGRHKGTRTSVKKRTPALCEDGSPPVRGPEGFSCADGSEPSCADGSEPLTADGQPLCEAPGESGGEDAAGECPAETAECEAAQASCEAGSEGGETPAGCEGEGEASAGAEAERAQPAVSSSIARPWDS